MLIASNNDAFSAEMPDGGSQWLMRTVKTGEQSFDASKFVLSL